MNRTIKYYKTKNKKCYIKEFIDSQPVKIQQKILWTLKLLKELEFLREPYFKKLTNTDNLWEVSIDYGSNTFRLIGFLDKGYFVVLVHGFRKKSQKTPKQAIALAQNRRKDYFRRKSNE